MSYTSSPSWSEPSRTKWPPSRTNLQRSWIPSPVQVQVQCQAHCLLQTSSTTPSQTRDSNPHPPIGDFDCGGDLDTSSPTAVESRFELETHLTRHCLLQTSTWVTGRIPHPPRVKLETHLHLMVRHCLPGSGPGPGPGPDLRVTHPTQGPSRKGTPPTTGKDRSPNPTHHLSNPAVADGGDLISTGIQFVSHFISTGKTFSFQINFILKLFTYITSLFQENFPGSSTSDGNHTHI